MNVLSLFDGCAMALQALKNLGIKVDNYFASEIDKYAIKIAMKNHPEIIQLGDITEIKSEDLPKIDLIIGGSPCQGFSFAGKQLNFNDERSKLFFEFIRLVNECKPKYFLLENVKMKKEYKDIISEYLGVEPIEINSSLVSAQNRKRLYWTNITNVKQPEDLKIYLKDVLENGVVDRDKSYCLDASYWKGTNLEQYLKKCRRQIVFNKPERVCIIGKGGQGQRVYSINGKSVTLSANGGGQGTKTGLYGTTSDQVLEECVVRKLTPVECERLQTLPDNYTEGVSNTQRYKMLGNGFTVKIIEHILKNIIL